MTKALLIYWKDAASEDMWMHVDEIKASYHLIQTLGWLITETDEVLVLGLNHDVTQDNYACMIHIPKVCILHQQELEIPRDPTVQRRSKDKA